LAAPLSRCSRPLPAEINKHSKKPAAGERAFHSLAGESALHATLDGHERGMQVLGLIP